MLSEDYCMVLSNSFSNLNLAINLLVAGVSRVGRLVSAKR